MVVPTKDDVTNGNPGLKDNHCKEIIGEKEMLYWGFIGVRNYTQFDIVPYSICNLHQTSYHPLNVS